MNYIKKHCKGRYLIILSCVLLFIIHKNKKWGGEFESWNNICSDGRGYYAWLPATFIYNDLNFNFFKTIEKDEKNMPNVGCYQNYINLVNGKQINKYYPGTSICMLPFFMGAHAYCILTKNYEPNGYTTPYFIAVGIAAMFWLYIGVFMLWKIFDILNLSELSKTISLLLILFGSNAIYFSVDSLSYSHIYSFGLISIFLWLLYTFKSKPKVYFLYLIALVYGWIVISRPVNGTVIFLIPFVIGIKNLKNIFIETVIKPYRFFLVIVAGISFPLLLFSLYKLSTGSFFVYSYGKEGFNFLSPHLVDFLFSLDNGLVVYLPILALPFIFSFITPKDESYVQYIGVLLTLSITIYIHSSWWCWSYGGSFGSRTLLDFLSLFGVLIGLNIKCFSERKQYLPILIYFLLTIYTLKLYNAKTHGKLFQYPITKVDYMESLIP